MLHRRGAGGVLGVIGLLVALAAAVSPAVAGTHAGVPDGNGHPAVGHIFGQISDPSQGCKAEIEGGCVAVLVAPRVLVTTGGCAETFANATDYGYTLTATWVTFNPNDPFDCAQASKVQSFQYHPFDMTYKDFSGNIGVVLLEADAPVAPATLPAAGELDASLRGDPFTSVSYSSDTVVTAAIRRAVQTSLRTTDADTIGLHIEDQNCYFGYEGGGAFLGDTSEVGALFLIGGGCKNGEFLRLDTPIVRDFLSAYVTLP